MTDSGILLGRIWNIPIRLHLSWFVIFFLVTWSLASGYLPSEYPQLSTTVIWVIAAVTSILFALSVLLHELGHSFVAQRNEVPVKSVTLFLFGGVATISKEPQNGKAELLIAIAGPLTSLLLAGIFGALWLVDHSIPFLAAPSAWLARINLMLALFNMIPGFPLDGGRVLRAAVWHFSGDLRKATRIATFAGQVIAFGFIGYGLMTIFTGNLYNGIWLAFIGWFLQNAAASTYSQVTVQETLRGVTVDQVMESELDHIPWNTHLKDLVESKVLQEGKRLFIVTDASGQTVRGMVTVRNITNVPREQWDDMVVDQVMIPRRELVSVTPTTQLLDALRVMDDANVAQLPVIENEKVNGFLCRDHVLRYIRLRSEIGL